MNFSKKYANNFMENKYYVYHLIDPNTNVPFYVGMGSGRRMYQHEILANAGQKSNNNGHLFNKINKVVRDSGKIDYKLVLENVDVSIAKIKEQEEIKRIGRSDLHLGPLCNLTDGGEGSPNLSPESLARKRKKCAYPKTEDHKRKLSISHTGKKLSLATIEKLKQRPINAWHYKHHHSIESKMKIGASRKGKTWEEIYGAEEAFRMREQLKLRHKLGLMPLGGRKQLRGKHNDNRP